MTEIVGDLDGKKGVMKVQAKTLNKALPEMFEDNSGHGLNDVKEIIDLRHTDDEKHSGEHQDSTTEPKAKEAAIGAQIRKKLNNFCDTR